MITRSQIQFYLSLGNKKERDEALCFVAEGDKIVREALALSRQSPYRVSQLFALKSWLEEHPTLIPGQETEIIEVSERELQRISFQKAPNQATAIISRAPEVGGANFDKELIIGLEQVQDPGNVGTIIRLADWFGITAVIASLDTADFYSPKVVQATMGSIFRVRLITTDLRAFTQSLQAGFPVYGTHLRGKNIFTAELSSNGLILMGNESRGLSAEILETTTENILIPDFSTGSTRPESLNVSVAAAIVCSEFRRRGNG